MYYTQQEINTIIIQAENKLALLGIDIINESSFRGSSILKDDLIRFTQILKAVKYRKLYEELEVGFQHLVELLGSIPYYREIETIINNDTVVSAGMDFNVQLPNTFTNLNGTAENYDSVLWEQLAGPNTAIIENPQSLITRVSGLTSGNYIFKLTAFKDNQAVSDSVSVLVTGVGAVVRYFKKSTNTIPTESEILSYPSIGILSQEDYILIFENTTIPMYFGFVELLTEPIKGSYQDQITPSNNGNIGTSEDLFKMPVSIGSFRVYMTNYKTIIPSVGGAVNPIKFIKAAFNYSLYVEDGYLDENYIE